MEQFERVTGGGILYDASRLRKPAAGLFETGYWQAQGRLQESLEASAGGKRPRASAKQATHKRAAKSTRRKTA